MLLGQMMNTPLTITSVMQFADKVYPNGEIVSQISATQKHRYTYAEAFCRVRKLANALLASGIRPGDRVATLAWNDYRHFELYYAVSCIGAVCHTLNPRLFPEQIEYIINHAEDKLLFVDPGLVSLLDGIRDRIPSVQQTVVLSEDYEAFIGEHSASFDWPLLDEQSASSLCYTSGTTGDPKGVLYSHRSTVLHSYACAMPDAMNLSARDVVMPLVPMFHVNAWGLPYACPMVGATLVLPGAFMGDGHVLTQLINDEGVSLSAGVPTVWLALLNALKEQGAKVPSLERLIVGGAACPLSIMDEFREAYQVEVRHAWGMTETSPAGVLNSLKPGMENLPKEALDRIRLKQGRPIFGMEFKIVDEHNREQAWDGLAVGEVKVRGPWVCSSYYRQDSGSAHDHDGWFATGDIASFDHNGYMQITDRAKDVIKSGGEWISSIELENAAMGHPQVKEAAVIGIPDPKWGERPLLFVVKEGPCVGGKATAAGKGEVVELDAQVLLDWLKDRVVKWWVPERVEFVDELPHTATGKLDKKVLRGR